MCMGIGTDQEVAPCFARSIRRPRVIAAGFGKRCVVGLKRTEHLIGRYVMKALPIARRFPGGQRAVQERVRANDIGAHKSVGRDDRTVDVAFSGEMYHKVEGVMVKQRLEQRGVADVAMDELEMRMTLHGVEIGTVSRVSERIEHDDQIVWM